MNIVSRSEETVTYATVSRISHGRDVDSSSELLSEKSSEI